MIIDNKILEIVKEKGQYRFVDKDGVKYVILLLDEDGHAYIKR